MFVSRLSSFLLTRPLSNFRNPETLVQALVCDEPVCKIWFVCVYVHYDFFYWSAIGGNGHKF